MSILCRGELCHDINCSYLVSKYFLNQVRALFLEIVFVRTSVCVRACACVCVCVCVCVCSFSFKSGNSMRVTELIKKTGL